MDETYIKFSMNPF